MTRGWAPCRAAILFGALLSLTRPVRAGEPPPKPVAAPPTPSEMADRFVAALAKGDEPGILAIVRSEESNPYYVVDALLGRHAAAVLGPGPSGFDWLAAAEAYAQRVSPGPAADGVRRVVEARRTFSHEDLERDERLRAALDRSWTQPQEVALAEVEKLRDDLAAAKPSLTSVRLGARFGDLLRTGGRDADAATAYRAAAQAAHALPYPWLEANAHQFAGSAEERCGNLDAAVAEMEAALAIRASLRQPNLEAWVSRDLGKLEQARGRLDPALSRFQHALELYGAQGKRADAAQVRVDLARVYAARNDFARAVPLFEEGLRESEALADPAGVYYAALEFGNVLHEQGKVDRALEMWERARAAAESLGDRRRVGLALTNLGTLKRERGEYGEALALLERSLREAEAVQDEEGAALARANVAAVLNDQGKPAQSIEASETALRALRKRGDRASAAGALQNLAAAYDALGRYTAAFAAYETVLAEQRALGDREGVGDVLVCLGMFEGQLGRPERAIERLEEALREREAIGNTEAVATTLDLLGQARSLGGDFRRAIEDYERALKMRGAPGDAGSSAGLLARIAFAHLRLQDPAKARTFVARSLEEAERRHDSGALAFARRVLAMIELEAGDPTRAVEAWERAVADAEASGDRLAVADDTGNLANAYLKAERPALAIRSARRSLEVRLSLAEGLGEDALGLGSEGRKATDTALLAATSLAASAPAGNPELLREASWFCESTRGLLLAEMLRNRRALLEANLPVDLVNAVGEARGRIEYRRHTILNLLAEKAPDPERLAEARRGLDAAYEDLDQVLGREQREQRRVAQVAHPVPATLTELQATLPADGALVTYTLTDVDAVALVVTPRTAALVNLGRAPAIEEEAGAYLRVASVAEGDEAALAAKLYEALLRPLESHLPEVKRLIVSPDGVLAFLPFEALLRAGGEGRPERAVERWEVTYVPSGTVYATLRADGPAPAKGGAFLGLGDPLPSAPPPSATVGGLALRDADLLGLASLPPLPGSAAEIDAIAGMFPAPDRLLLLQGNATIAELSKILQAGRRLAVLHVACHGYLDTERPRLTGLVLSGGEVLSVDDIYRLHVPADLVVLSACQTGKGRLLRGEGVMGLVRAFFFAGSPRVVVSNWRVADASTRRLMGVFYEKMRRDGLSPAAALRDAKIDAIQKGGPGAHPFHWAAFVLWGLET